LEKFPGNTMARSLKKGPFIDPKLLAKVEAIKASGKNTPIKTWSRRSQIAPQMVNLWLEIHNGKVFKKVLVTENMVGEYLGALAPSRSFRTHGKITKRVESKT
jgi:small subunit ribosomal protein S19